MVMLARLAQLRKASTPMLVTLLGMANEEPVFPAGYVCKAVLPLLYNTPLSEVYAEFPASTFIAGRMVQSPKAPFPMLVTLAGMVTLARLIHD